MADQPSSIYFNLLYPANKNSVDYILKKLNDQKSKISRTERSRSRGIVQSIRKISSSSYNRGYLVGSYRFLAKRCAINKNTVLTSYRKSYKREISNSILVPRLICLRSLQLGVSSRKCKWNINGDNISLCTKKYMHYNDKLLNGNRSKPYSLDSLWRNKSLSSQKLENIAFLTDLSMNSLIPIPLGINGYFNDLKSCQSFMLFEEDKFIVAPTYFKSNTNAYLMIHEDYTSILLDLLNKYNTGENFIFASSNIKTFDSEFMNFRQYNLFKKSAVKNDKYSYSETVKNSRFLNIIYNKKVISDTNKIQSVVYFKNKSLFKRKTRNNNVHSKLVLKLSQHKNVVNSPDIDKFLFAETHCQLQTSTKQIKPKKIKSTIEIPTCNTRLASIFWAKKRSILASKKSIFKTQYIQEVLNNATSIETPEFIYKIKKKCPSYYNTENRATVFHIFSKETITKDAIMKHFINFLCRENISYHIKRYNQVDIDSSFFSMKNSSEKDLNYQKNVDKLTNFLKDPDVTPPLISQILRYPVSYITNHPYDDQENSLIKGIMKRQCSTDKLPDLPFAKKSYKFETSVSEKAIISQLECTSNTTSIEKISKKYKEIISKLKHVTNNLLVFYSDIQTYIIIPENNPASKIHRIFYLSIIQLLKYVTCTAILTYRNNINLKYNIPVFPFDYSYVIKKNLTPKNGEKILPVINLFKTELNI